MKTKHTLPKEMNHPSKTSTLRANLKKLLQITVFSAILMAGTESFACEGANLQRANTLADQTIQLMDNVKARGFSLDLIQTMLRLDRVYRQFPFSCRQAYDVWARKQFSPSSQLNVLSGYGNYNPYGLQQRIDGAAIRRQIDKLPW